MTKVASLKGLIPCFIISKWPLWLNIFHNYCKFILQIANSVKSRFWLFSQKMKYGNVFHFITSHCFCVITISPDLYIIFQESLLTVTNSSIKTAEVSKQQWTLAKGLKRHCRKTCNTITTLQGHLRRNYSFYLMIISVIRK